MKINQKESMNTYGNQWKPLKTNEHMNINENKWKSMDINEDHWTSMKIIEHQWKYVAEAIGPERKQRQFKEHIGKPKKKQRQFKEHIGKPKKHKEHLIQTRNFKKT